MTGGYSKWWKVLLDYYMIMAIQLLSSFYVYLRCIQSLHHNIYIFWSGQMSADGSVFTEASFSSLLFSLVREEQELFAVTMYLHAKVTVYDGVRGCVSVCVRWESEFFPKLASPWHVFDAEAETGLTEDEVMGNGEPSHPQNMIFQIQRMVLISSK